jgi:hypothetical protein
MTRDELTDRILELFPKLAEVEPWDWDETEDSEPVMMIERHATFTPLRRGRRPDRADLGHRQDRCLADRAGRPLRVEGSDGRPDRHGGSRAGEAQLVPVIQREILRGRCRPRTWS